MASILGKRQPSSQPVRQSRTGGESKQRDWPWPGPETETEAETESGSECMLADKRMLIGAARLANCGGSGAFLSQAKRAVRLWRVWQWWLSRAIKVKLKSASAASSGLDFSPPRRSCAWSEQRTREAAGWTCSSSNLQLTAAEAEAA